MGGGGGETMARDSEGRGLGLWGHRRDVHTYHPCVPGTGGDALPCASFGIAKRTRISSCTPPRYIHKSDTQGFTQKSPNAAAAISLV